MRPSFRSSVRGYALIEDSTLQLNEFLTGFPHTAGEPEGPRQPVVLIVGVARSGTSVVYQYLASSGLFSFPTNLMARFYGSAHFAARVQRQFTDPSTRGSDELSTLEQSVSLQSEYGKTRGLLQPSEFWYFWRRFFPLDVPRPISEISGPVNPTGFAAELADMEQVLGKPLLMKSMLLCFDLGILDQAIEKPLFVFVERDLVFNAQSLLIARQRLLGSMAQWYSTRPPEYAWLKDAGIAEQVVGQVHFTNTAIRRQLAQLSPASCVHVRYEDFCRQPDALLDEVRRQMGQLGFTMDTDGTSRADSLNCTNQPVLTPELFDALEARSREISNDPQKFMERCGAGGQV